MWRHRPLDVFVNFVHLPKFLLNEVLLGLLTLMPSQLAQHRVPDLVALAVVLADDALWERPRQPKVTHHDSAQVVHQ